MSDSDELLTNNNVFAFQNESTMISVKGPNVNVSNMTGIDFQNNGLSSTMQRARNFERPRYAESNHEQQNMYRRETSPMSTMSACDVRQRNFNNFYYPGMSLQKSAFNGRSGSAMSVRSIDSTASISAADITMALKSNTYNEYDLRQIRDACSKLMKRTFRKKIEKRKNLRQFLKGGRFRSGGESGEQGSDSSLSSDDRSTRTSHYRGNISRCRSVKTDITALRRTIKENNMYNDCSGNFRHNSFRNTVGGPVNHSNTQESISSHRSIITGSNVPSSKSMPVPSYINSMQRQPSVPVMPQNERFKSGFLLPSQRFNRSVASATIPETAENDRSNLQNGEVSAKNRKKNTLRNIDTDSDKDDIFSEATTKQNTNNNMHSKRSIDSVDDICLSSPKRMKIASPYTNTIEAGKPNPKETNVNKNDKENDFVFTKPTFPVRKSAKEKLISKSTTSISDILIPASIIPTVNIQHSQSEKPLEQDIEKDNQDEHSNASQNKTDLSMRPSFIKRKLFTQKLDVTEKKNTSIDNTNSPQNSIYGAIQKEKHKARKLQQVTSRSCLKRDVQQDKSNFLDLINKLVPLEQINAINQRVKTDSQISKTKTDEDKWDVTSIISARKSNEDVSDTYTDEEIFNATVKELAKENVSKKPSPVKGKVCKVMLSTNISLQSKQCNNDKNDVRNKSVQKCIQSFWDTDFESDAEVALPRNGHNYLEENHQKESLRQTVAPKLQECPTMINSNTITAASTAKASTFQDKTIDSVQKFYNTSLRIRSHRSHQRKKIEQTRDEDPDSALFEAQNKKQKIFQASSCIELSKLEPTKSNETAPTHLPKQKNKKSPKSKKQASKIDKNNKSNSIKELTPKKQTKNNKKQVKDPSELKTLNNKKETVLIEEEINKKAKQNKTTQISKKSDKKKDNNIIEEQTTEKLESAKTSPKNNDMFESKLIKKQLNNNKKDKLAQLNTETKKQSNTIKILTEPQNKKGVIKTKAENKIRSPKTKKTSKTKIKSNCSDNEDTTIEKNNNTSCCRPVRSCRISKLNESLDKSDLNVTRALRSRQIEYGNFKKSKQDMENDKSKLSDVSFSITADKNAVHKRTITKLSNLRLFKAKDVETSDVSFSLTANESPTSLLRNVVLTKSTELTKKACQRREIFVSQNVSKPSRIRTPNKRYMMI